MYMKDIIINRCSILYYLIDAYKYHTLQLDKLKSKINPSFMNEAFHEKIYQPLIDDDQIQYQQSWRLNQKEYQIMMFKILKDFTMLLLIKEERIFWQHLRIQGQEEERDKQAQQADQNSKKFRGKYRLRMALQSCLHVFGRSQYISKKQQMNQRQKRFTLSKSLVWNQIKKVVLLIFYKISCALPQYRSIVQDYWYIDTCKILDLCMIYNTNQAQKRILKKIIQNIYTQKSQVYQQDYKQVVNLIKDKLRSSCAVLHGLDLNLERKVVRSTHNKGEIVQTKLLIAQLYSIYDVIVNMQIILSYFPTRQILQLLSQPLILKRLVMIYCKIQINLSYKWKFGENEKIFKQVVYKTLQKLCVFTGNILQILCNLITDYKANLSKQIQYNMNLCFLNFWYFTIQKPATIYEDKQDEKLQKACIEHGKNLIEAILMLNFKQNKIFNRQILTKYNKNSKDYIIISNCYHFCQTLYSRLMQKKLQKIEKWRLPNAKEYIKDILIRKSMKQYQDQFQDEVSLSNWQGLLQDCIQFYDWFQQQNIQQQSETKISNKIQKSKIQGEDSQDDRKQLVSLQLSSIAIYNSVSLQENIQAMTISFIQNEILDQSLHSLNSLSQTKKTIQQFKVEN